MSNVFCTDQLLKTLGSEQPGNSERGLLKFSNRNVDLKGPLLVRGVPQFRTVVREDFTSGKAEGWDNPGTIVAGPQ